MQKIFLKILKIILKITDFVVLIISGSFKNFMVNATTVKSMMKLPGNTINHVSGKRTNIQIGNKTLYNFTSLRIKPPFSNT